MVLKLYSTTGSACAQRVAVVLNEKGIPFELSLVDAANGEHKGAEYLKKQPFGQIPYIVRRYVLRVYRDFLLTHVLGRRWLYSIRKPCHMPIHRSQVSWKGD